MKIKIHAQRIYPPLEDLTVTPTTTKQEFTHPNSYGYDKLEIEAVTADIDENIQPENIKKDVTILGKVGTLEVPVIQPLKTVTLSSTEQTITPDSGYDVMGEVGVNVGFTNDGIPTMFDGTTVVLPDNVTTIGKNGFFYTRIKNISGAEVTELKSEAFASGSLKTADFPKLVTMGVSAFNYCAKLTSVTLPSTLRYVGSQALYATNVTELIFKDGLETIMPNSITYDYKLTTVHLPASITTFGTNNFTGCNILEFLTVGQGWKLSMNLSYSTKFSQSTLEAIIDNLADLTGQTAQTLTIGATNIAKLTAEEIAIATIKGWIVN